MFYKEITAELKTKIYELYKEADYNWDVYNKWDVQMKFGPTYAQQRKVIQEIERLKLFDIYGYPDVPKVNKWALVQIIEMAEVKTKKYLTARLNALKYLAEYKAKNTPGTPGAGLGDAFGANDDADYTYRSD